jgi:hypothetical protein
MKNLFTTLIIVCSLSISSAQSKKEITHELTIQNASLKQEISKLNDKIASLNAENKSLKKELAVGKIETPQDYGRTLFDLFKSERLLNYPELQFQLKDTIVLLAKDVNIVKESINEIQKNALEFYLEGINKGIDWSKVEYERFEYEIKNPNGDISTIHLRGKFYFNYLGKKFHFDNEASILDNGKWRGYIFDDLVNETEELEKEKKEEQSKLNEPYIPNGIKFGTVNFAYQVNEVNPKTMFSLKIPIQNNTNYSIDWIKFQFRIYENGELRLSKNIIISEHNGFDSKLEPGEKEMVELNDIGEVFIDSGVRNENWYTDIKLLEVKPKPIKN